MKAQTQCRARARKAVLPPEVFSCAVLEKRHWALDTVSGWETRPVGAPGCSFLPASRNKQLLARVNQEWGAKGSQACGCDLCGAAGGQGWDSPGEMLSSCCLITANETCKAGLGERMNQDERVWDNLALRY